MPECDIQKDEKAYGFVNNNIALCMHCMLMHDNNNNNNNTGTNICKAHNVNIKR